MSVPEAIIQGVTIKPGAEEMVHAAELDPATGFLRVDSDHLEGLGQAAFIGFGVSGWQQGTTEVAESFEPVNAITLLDPELVTVARQGKGIGARVYNTPQALDGTAESPERIGMYSFSVDEVEDYTGRPIRLAAKQVFLAGASRLLGTERAMFINDSRQGETDALLYDQTIDGRRRRQQGTEGPSAVPERLMVVRNPNVTFELVGLYEKTAAERTFT